MLKNLLQNRLFWIALLTFLFALWNILSPFGFLLEPGLADAIVALDWTHIPYALLSAVSLIWKGGKKE